MGVRDDQPRRIGILGGTFDPIHIGHLVAASEALHRFRLDRILFVPAGSPWQKQGYSDAEDRYLMTVMAAAEHHCFAVSRTEIDRRGPTYTVDTLSELRGFHPEAELFFILGADAASNLSSWHGLDRLGELAEMIVVPRPGAPGSLDTQPHWPRINELPMPLIGVSATEIRRRAASDEPIDFLVPARVARHIRENGLYAGRERDAHAGR